MEEKIEALEANTKIPVHVHISTEERINALDQLRVDMEVWAIEADKRISALELALSKIQKE
jgi:hypothetical protein